MNSEEQRRKRMADREAEEQERREQGRVRLADYSLDDSTNHPDCMGCLSSGDIGLGGSAVAYAHPMCPKHGASPHKFRFSSADGFGRLICTCGAYQTEHEEQRTTSLLRLEIARERAGGYIERSTELFAYLYGARRW